MCSGFGDLFLFGRWIAVVLDGKDSGVPNGITVNPSLVSLLATSFINTAL